MENREKSLAELVDEVEVAAKSWDENFSIRKWFKEIGKVKSISEVYEKNGLPSGYVVFWYTGPAPEGHNLKDYGQKERGITLNTDIGYIYSKDEDIELSKEVVHFIERGIWREFEGRSFLSFFRFEL